MEQFMVKDFQNHAAINGEYIKFMVHNNSSDDVSTYKEELCSMERKFTAFKTDVNTKLKALEAKCTQATSASNTASNKSKEIVETIKKLATKADLLNYQKK